MDEYSQLSIRIPRRLHHALRIAAIEREQRIRDMIADAIQAYLSAPGPSRRKQKAMGRGRENAADANPEKTDQA